MPSDRTAQLCWLLTLTAVTPVNPGTLIGVLDGTLVPSPSSPEELYPQHFTVPSASEAQECRKLVSIVVAPARPETSTGV